MSRIGRMPIAIPAGVDVKLDDASKTIQVKGPNGALSQAYHTDMTVKVEDGVIHVERPSDQKAHKALHGLTRALINNMVVGVTKGYSKQLEINGVGYRAQKQGKQLVMNLGYSHNVVFDEPAGITIEVPNQNTVIVKGADKQAVGQLAAEIRKSRLPEPYLGKGIKYSDEVIRRKESKSGKK